MATACLDWLMMENLIRPSPSWGPMYGCADKWTTTLRSSRHANVPVYAPHTASRKVTAPTNTVERRGRVGGA